MSRLNDTDRARYVARAAELLRAAHQWSPPTEPEPLRPEHESWQVRECLEGRR